LMSCCFVELPLYWVAASICCHLTMKRHSTFIHSFIPYCIN
jgi:hypothetical protein